MDSVFSQLWKIGLFGCVFLLTDCTGYKQHIMFQPENGDYSGELAYEKRQAEGNYRIQINDRLAIRVFTNDGERIIDPDYALQEEIKSNAVRREEIVYTVEHDGSVKVPMIGSVQMTGLSIREAESMLEKEFAKFYKEPFVTVRFENKRVIVLGMTVGQVIKLENENMTLIEVLALAGGIEEDHKVQNIRLIRGDLKDPEVQIIDLSTIEGMMRADLEVYSGDIIYVEPVVRGFSRTSREILPIVSVLASVVAIIVAIQALSNN